MMAEEMRKHLMEGIIPFWRKMRDDRYGGYYGYMDHALKVDKAAVKGCILNSRITWFFSNVCLLLKEEGGGEPEGEARDLAKDLLKEARHGYVFLRDRCMDRERGGVYWSLRYDGSPEDETKHTYNQAFAIYALSSYYDASREEEALELALGLFHLIEERCRDEIGYREAFDRNFGEIGNEKLSENGVMADRTMNTLLHVFEAYTELYRVCGDSKVGERLRWILDTFASKVYNPGKHRQEVFFDRQMHSILDLTSYGHDIETAWLLERGCDVLGEEVYREKMRPIVLDLTDQVYRAAFDGHSLANECERGVVDETRIWWVQAEAVVGFLNGYQLVPHRKEYLEAARAVWEFIQESVIDSRPGSEWFWAVTKAGGTISGKPLVEPWKCPYHNGRMCLEVLRGGRPLAFLPQMARIHVGGKSGQGNATDRPQE